MTARSIALAAATGLALPMAARAGGDPRTAAAVVAAADQEGKLVVYSSTDSVIAAPLLKDFAALHPRIQVEFNDLNTTEIYNRFVAEAAAGAGTGDLLWSSSMDLQMKLVQEGYAADYRSPEAPDLPAWATYRGEAYGTTYEPIVFVYNKRLLKPEEVPQTHAALAALLRAQTPRFKGKLTAYDPERSGVGFLLVTQDAREDPAFDETAKAYGLAGIRLYTSVGAMLERIGSGEHVLGFNIFASYASARQKKDPSLGVVYPQDYCLVLSRIAFVPKAAKHPNAAKVFLDYLLSRRGQEVVAKAGLGSIRPDVQGEGTAATLSKTLGQSLRPIAVGPTLLEHLDQGRRLDFLNRWQKALGTK